MLELTELTLVLVETSVVLIDVLCAGLLDTESEVLTVMLETGRVVLITGSVVDTVVESRGVV